MDLAMSDIPDKKKAWVMILPSGGRTQGYTHGVGD